MDRLLIIGGDEGQCAALSKSLSGNGVSVEVEHDGLVGLKRALRERFDVLAVEAALPGIGGFAVLEQFRRQSGAPVLMLMPKHDRAERIRALELGADDCLVKPVDPEEMLARLHAIRHRRSSAPAKETQPLRAGELTVFPASCDAYLGDERLDLTPMECEILEQLVRAAGWPVSRDQLSLLLYSRPATAFDRSMDTHIARIRRKLGGQRNMIMSVRGTGYQLRVPARREA